MFGSSSNFLNMGCRHVRTNTQREAQRLAAPRQSARGQSPLGNKHKNTR